MLQVLPVIVQRTMREKGRKPDSINWKQITGFLQREGLQRDVVGHGPTGCGAGFSWKMHLSCPKELSSRRGKRNTKQMTISPNLGDWDGMGMGMGIGMGIG